MKKKIIVFISLILLIVFSINNCVYAVSQEAEDALNALTNYIENGNQTNDDIAKAYYMRGYIYEHEYDDIDKALADYNMTVKYNPNHKMALLLISKIKCELKDYDGAMEPINKLMKLYPDTSEFLNLAGFILYSSDKKDDAIKMFTRSIVLKNKNPEAFEYRGRCEIKKGLTEKGYKDLEYAKIQYYELNDIENYKRVVETIDTLKNPKSYSNSKYSNNAYYQDYSPRTRSPYSDSLYSNDVYPRNYSYQRSESTYSHANDVTDWELENIYFQLQNLNNNLRWYRH